MRKKKRFRTLTKELKHDLHQKLKGRKDFSENKRFGSREERERSKYLRME